MSDNETSLSSKQEAPDTRFRNIVLSTEAGMSVYSLADLDTITNNPDDLTTISRLNDIRLGTHDDEEAQTDAIGDLFDELKKESLGWDIYAKSDMDKGFLDDYNWLNWEDVATALNSAKTGQQANKGQEGSSASIRSEPGVETVVTAERTEEGFEDAGKPIQAAEELQTSVAQEVTYLTESAMASEVSSGEVREDRTEFRVDVMYPGEEVVMTDAPVDRASNDEDMMDIDDPEGTQHEYRNADMSD
jgi:hypothetical protein